MGCDFSKETKEDFDRQTDEINKSIILIKKQQESLKATISQMPTETKPIETIQDLRKSLLPHLEKIESLLVEIKNSKENNSFDRQKNSRENNRHKFQVSTKAESSEPLSRGESPGNRVEKDINSILEDPTIKAMIEKNRKKFVRVNKKEEKV